MTSAIIAAVLTLPLASYPYGYWIHVRTWPLYPLVPVLDLIDSYIGVFPHPSQQNYQRRESWFSFARGAYCVCEPPNRDFFVCLARDSNANHAAAPAFAGDGGRTLSAHWYQW